uniref:RPGRIP1 C-terminal domain-containing protein n=1 Tax=Timema cristinae TaxID=61476 RepID=A0A7R9H8Q7_TIMCR|nr:unnamed protein product [Timema cristinae]
MPTQLREGPWPFGNLIEGDIFTAHVKSTQGVRCTRVTFYPASVLFSRYREGASDGFVLFFHAALVSKQTGFGKVRGRSGTLSKGISSLRMSNQLKVFVALASHFTLPVFYFPGTAKGPEEDELVIDINYLWMAPLSSPMLDFTLMQFYIDYTFLEYFGENMETKSVHRSEIIDNKLHFNYSKIDKSIHGDQHKLLAEMFNKSTSGREACKIRFVVVSEPLEEDSSMQDCGEIGKKNIFTVVGMLKKLPHSDNHVHAFTHSTLA